MEALQVVGAVAATAAAATAILTGRATTRAWAMVAALAIAVVLIAGESWNDQLGDLRDSPATLLGLVAAAVVLIGGLAALFGRHPILLPLALLAALPFRIPIDAGGDSSNLLVPLYAVIAAGMLAHLRRPTPPDRSWEGPARWLGIALSVSIVVYAVQSSYSSDVSRAVQNIGFFLVPFGVLFVLLREAEWTPRLLRLAVTVVVAEAVIFGAIGILQHETGEIFWNSKVMESNEFNAYFRVNSLFWDPNIYGRYLALAALLAVAALVWNPDRRRLALGTAAVAVIFFGMAFSFSQTSFLAFLVGIAVLCALRWSFARTLAVTGAALVAAAIAIAFTGLLEADSESPDSLEETTSGRSTLVSEGLDLARDRPLTGYGSGSFAVEFEERNPVPEGEAAVSHTEPITVAAEQGAAGLAVYVAVVLAALSAVFGGMRRFAPGLGGRTPSQAEAPIDDRVRAAARIAIAAAFAAMLAHTVGYAGFLADPLTWALLAVGSSLRVGGETPSGFSAPPEHTHPRPEPASEPLPPP